VTSSYVSSTYSSRSVLDLDSISDPLQKEATAGIIHNFGQTPKQMFTAPHPPRSIEGPSTLPCGVTVGIIENLNLLHQQAKPTIGGSYQASLMNECLMSSQSRLAQLNDLCLTPGMISCLQILEALVHSLDLLQNTSNGLALVRA
jgi:hypothetical protein